MLLRRISNFEYVMRSKIIVYEAFSLATSLCGLVYEALRY
jgi:hypothetical protein